MKGILKPWDIPVIILTAVLTLLAAGAVYSGRTASSRVIIRGPDNSWIFPLNTELELSVGGPLGESRVLLHSGQAGIISSPCAGQSCVAAGGLYRNGQWTACLPNRVFIVIEGMEDSDAPDAHAW